MRCDALIVGLVSSFVLLLSFPGKIHAEEPRMWFYLSTNLLVDENLEKGLELLQRASKSGYNGVLVADSKFSRWGDLPERYERNVKRFREECRRLNLACFAAVCPVGYSNDLLSHNPNCAEGLPVVDAPFLVKDGKLVPEPFSNEILANDSFESHRNHSPDHWGFVDDPGKISFIDSEIKCDGEVSLRMQGDGSNEYRNARASQKISVTPFQHYRLSVMLKTEDFDALGATRIAVIASDGRQLNWHMPALKRTEDWRRIDITFNSLNYDTLTLYLGTWGIQGGKIWWDAAKLQPAGFVNILRRSGTPLRIVSEDGRTTYVEGEDFDRIVDTKLGNDPYAGCYTAWHEPPSVNIPAQSQLKEGQRVLASYDHATLVYEEQVSCCLACPEYRALLKWQIEQVHEHMDPDGYFMSHDEIRQGGWDGDCRNSGKTTAELLGDNVAFCVQTIRETAPGKPIAVWSDMFDPVHNAKPTDFYYLLKASGPWSRAWEKLPEDVIIANWNSDVTLRKTSLKHFSDRGNPQILAGYYDADSVEAIRPWMRDAAAVDGNFGVMYTTWQNRYEHLEAFAEAVRNERK